MKRTRSQVLVVSDEEKSNDEEKYAQYQITVELDSGGEEGKLPTHTGQKKAPRREELSSSSHAASEEEHEDEEDVENQEAREDVERLFTEKKPGDVFGYCETYLEEHLRVEVYLHHSRLLIVEGPVVEEKNRVYTAYNGKHASATAFVKWYVPKQYHALPLDQVKRECEVGGDTTTFYFPRKKM